MCFLQSQSNLFGKTFLAQDLLVVDLRCCKWLSWSFDLKEVQEESQCPSKNEQTADVKKYLKKYINKSGIDTYFSKIVEKFLQIAYFFGYILFWLTWGGGGAIPDGSSRESWLAMLLLKRKCKKINNGNNIMLYSNSLSLSNKKKIQDHKEFALWPTYFQTSELIYQWRYLQ